MKCPGFYYVCLRLRGMRSIRRVSPRRPTEAAKRSSRAATPPGPLKLKAFFFCSIT